ncbi:Uncharacterized membrane protein YjfL, UPF0719 family [Klenkia marina]|uniref:Uncharacterized membrane protein YjfL, UPF0719 family n=1 Tax=Klenkia marina TaxID=1960309 RepID=A0A1G4XEX7_9ACTN|nr:DUF350 domain-containing protein [Klenkia marina]SCX39749.1 Uncharacterized membrane protein YjfL, UPF0719 family [Klenkia marina]
MFLDTARDYLANWPIAALQVVVVAAFVAAFWYLVNALTSFDDNAEIITRGNTGYMVQRLALSAALVVGMLNSLEYRFDEIGWGAITNLLVEGAWVFVALLAARFVVDKVVLLRVDNVQAMREGNVAVGVVEAGFYLGLGLILNGSLIGSSPDWQTGLASTVVFAVLGLLVVVGVYFLHDLVTRGVIRRGIAAGSLPAAFEIAGILVAVSLVVRVGVAGDFTGWGDGLVAFAVTAVIAVVTLYLFRFLVDLVILRGVTVASIQRDGQVVAAGLMSGLFVVVALPVATVVAAQL